MSHTDEDHSKVICHECGQSCDAGRGRCPACSPAPATLIQGRVTNSRKRTARFAAFSLLACSFVAVIGFGFLRQPAAPVCYGDNAVVSGMETLKIAEANYFHTYRRYCSLLELGHEKVVNPELAYASRENPFSGYYYRLVVSPGRGGFFVRAKTTLDPHPSEPCFIYQCYTDETGVIFCSQSDSPLPDHDFHSESPGPGWRLLQ